MYPHFIGIGAQKAGTTWLSRNLQLHPEVWMPAIKELHYFDERIEDPANPLSRLSRKAFGKRDRDRRWRRQVRRRSLRHLKSFSREDFLWDLKYYAGAPNDGWYASLFEPGKGKTAGEITPAYSMLGPDAIAHVHALAPEARIVFMMRNPIERAWSQAAMRFDKAGEKAAEAASDAAGSERLRRHFRRKGSRSRTDYLGTLESWGSFYPRESIFVGFLEDVSFFPEELLERLYGFLGVDASFEPPGVSRRVHTRSAGRVPLEPMSHLARDYHAEISRLAERFGGYASFWLYCAERLIERPPQDETVPYPLWESAMWNEWKGEARLQSHQLSAINYQPSAGTVRGETRFARRPSPPNPS